MTQVSVRRVMVTGATGFIGSRVVRQLVAEGCEVIALTRPGGSTERVEQLGAAVTIVPGDFHHPAAWERRLNDLRPDALVHLAWHTVPGQYRSHPGNVTDLTASLGLLERAQGWGCSRFVGIGTCLEYDPHSGFLSEDVPLVPTSLYASCKAALYLSASAWAHKRGLSFAWARLFYQFGPGENPRRLIPSVVIALLTGRPLALTSGQQVRDYLHVDDVADAISRLIFSDAQGAFNVGSGRPMRVRDLVNIVESQIGKHGLIRIGELPEPEDEPPFICANNARLRRAVDWQPAQTLEERLSNTISWWANRTSNTDIEGLQ